MSFGARVGPGGGTADGARAISYDGVDTAAAIPSRRVEMWSVPCAAPADRVPTLDPERSVPS